MTNKSNFWLGVVFALLISGCGKPGADSPKAGASVENIKPAEAAAFLKENSSALVLDIRTPEEFADGHIEGAINIDFKGADFDVEIGKLDKSVPYVMHCASGGRSGKALSKFESLGFKEIHHLDAGFSGWNAEGLPVSQ